MIDLQLPNYTPVSQLNLDNNDNDSDSEVIPIVQSFTPHEHVNYSPQQPRSRDSSNDGLTGMAETYLTSKDPFWYSIYFKFISFMQKLLIFVAAIYILFLCLLFFQNSINEIHVLFSISSKPNHPRMDNCKFSANNIKSKISIYLLFAILDWFCYTLALRNWKLLFINSILWELIQYFLLKIPLFGIQSVSKCWFEAVIFNIFGTNLCGILLGLLLLKIMKIYSFFPEWFIVYKNLCQCHMFRHWIKFFLIALTLTLIVPMIELSGFIIFEYILWITSYHYLFFIRKGLYLLIIIGCFNQLYSWMYLDYFGCGKIIRSAYWIILLWIMITLEIVVCIRAYLS